MKYIKRIYRLINTLPCDDRISPGEPSMKSIVIYKTKSGFTKKYAQWIADSLSTKAVPVNDTKVKELKTYDAIIYGGGVYMGKINGVKWVKKNMKKLKDKRIIVFACGLGEEKEEDIIKIKDKNFTEDELRSIRFFYFKGGFDFDKLPFKERMMMSMVRKMMAKGEDLKDDEKVFLEALNEPVDHSDEEKIKDLIDHVKGSR